MRGAVIWRLLALVLGLGGTPHFATITWPHVMVIDSNADGTTFSRPALGYHVWRAEVKGGVQGPWLLLNPDVLVIGTLDGDGLPADGWYEDDEAVEGSTYVYSVSAVDMGGESAQSVLSGSVTVPINPSAPLKLRAQ